MRSLRRRYLMASAGVIGAVLITVTFAYRHVQQVSEQNTRALKLATRVTAALDRVPDALRHADHALQDLLVAPVGHRDSPMARHLDNALAGIAELAGDPALAGVVWHDQLVALEQRLQAFAEAGHHMLKQYDKPSWLYPALPLIAGAMFDANRELDTALENAIAETRARLGHPGQLTLYQQLVTLRALWRRIILDFRSSMIRFAGLPTEPLGDDRALREIYRAIQDRIAALEASPELWRDNFETAELVPEFAALAAAWFSDYHRVRELQASGRWRGDVQYATQVLRPMQQATNRQVLALEDAVAAWGAANTATVTRAAADIHHLLWALCGLTLVSLLINYLILDRGLLRPVGEVSAALSAHADGSREVTLPPGRHDEIARLVTAFEDMRSQIRVRQQALEHRALHDVLTELPNRALLRDRLEHGLRAIDRHPDHLGLLLLDLDRFKEINDSLGHHTGDEVLQEVARRLVYLVRDSDTVARLGGDEFAVVLPGLDRPAATELARRIARTLEQPYTVDGQTLYLGASIGVVVAPEDGRDPATLLRRADNAMYGAKRTGRDYAFYDPEQDGASGRSLRLAGRLRGALYGGPGLGLFYQPRLSLAEDRIVSVEALLHWQDPDGPGTTTEHLVRIAEHANLIHELTGWALERALHDCALCQGHGLALSVAVNLSARNLDDDTLVDMVRDGLQRHGLEPQQLTLEITEGAVMAEPSRARKQLEDLAAMGVTLSIDDFGTGFSSLAYLSQLPVHELKIDKSFVSGMTSSSNDRLIVQSIIQLAHNLGLQVVAEGVEDQPSLDRLRDQGCDAVQGYLVSRPLPLPELLELRESRTLRF